MFTFKLTSLLSENNWEIFFFHSLEEFNQNPDVICLLNSKTILMYLSNIPSLYKMSQFRLYKTTICPRNRAKQLAYKLYELKPSIFLAS